MKERLGELFMKTIEAKDKDKALEQVLADIEKQFGKGAIMKLGSSELMEIDVTSTGSLSLEEESLKYMDLNHQAKQLLHFMQLQKCKKLEVEQRLLMQNMP